jgi:glycosyltransferase involved in cell wall biosynthesis
VRLAFFSPLNPERSGIADYSEELLPYLAERAEIDLVINGYEPSNPLLKKRFAILGPAEFLRRKNEYDAVVYQVGNSYPYHAYMLPCLREAPGIVVLHDYSLSYLMLGMTLQRGDLKSLGAILRGPRGDHAGLTASDFLFSRVDPYESSLARPIIEMSTGVIVHNRYAQERLRKEYPDKQIAVVWHATPIRETVGNNSELRAKYGFETDDFLLASVSKVAYNKRFELVLRVLHRAVQQFPRLRLLVVSGGQLGSRNERLIRELGIQNHVVRTGWVSGEQYLDYIDMADAVIDLRYPTAGETSGSSLRVLQAGKPMIASAQGFFLELPEDCWMKVNVGGDEEEVALAALLRLLREPGLASRIGGKARVFTLQHLTREKAAKGYSDFIAKVLRSAPVPTGKWDFEKPGAQRAKSLLIKNVFRASRAVEFQRRYGIGEMLRRAFRES